MIAYYISLRLTLCLFTKWRIGNRRLWYSPAFIGWCRLCPPLESGQKAKVSDGKKESGSCRGYRRSRICGNCSNFWLVVEDCTIGYTILKWRIVSRRDCVRCMWNRNCISKKIFLVFLKSLLVSVQTRKKKKFEPRTEEYMPSFFGGLKSLSLESSRPLKAGFLIVPSEEKRHECISLLLRRTWNLPLKFVEGTRAE